MDFIRNERSSVINISWNNLFRNRPWINKFKLTVSVVAMCSSMFTLVVIAGDRFYAIMFPMHSRVTKRKVSYLLIIVWLASIAIATPLPFMFYYIERQWKDVLETYCDEKWPMRLEDDGTCDDGLTSKKAYWIIVCGVLNWTPMLVMTLSYTFIVIKLRKHKIGPKLGASSKSSVQQRSTRKVKPNTCICLVFVQSEIRF